MRRINLILVLIFFWQNTQIKAQYVNWEVFKPRVTNIQSVFGVSWQTLQIDTLQTIISSDMTTQSRIRGYIIPPQSGYYKFYLASDNQSDFWLSTDSVESNIKLICKLNNLGPGGANYTWPTNPQITDSVYLEFNKPYYFESFCKGFLTYNNNTSTFFYSANYLKIGWVLPNSNQLEVITGNNLRPAKQKQSSSVNWEIFKNKTSYDFSTLKSTDSIPDQIMTLDSVYTPNYSTGMDRFASRIKGYIIPPVSGNYSFYFACDDVGQFWLSIDSSQTGAQLINNISTIQTDWNQNISNQILVAGQKYFFEILHYDTAYTDMIKLGWKIPGDTVPTVIKKPFISNYNDGIPVTGFSFFDTTILTYQNQTFTPPSIIRPWNASNKGIKWKSTNDSIATIDANCVIKTLRVGTCQIIGLVDSDTTLSDTLNITVTDYSGPFFVKPSASASGDGRSWDHPIELGTLLEILNKAQLQQQVTIYASEGIYKPTTTIDRNKTFWMPNIKFYGGYDSANTQTDTSKRNVEIHKTILSGDIGVQDDNFDNSYHVVTAYKNTIIDGVTVSDGRASCSSYGWTPGYYQYKPDDNGGGIFVPGAVSNIKVNNCTIKNNSAWNSGAGIHCFRSSINVNQSSTVELENSAIHSNMMQQTYITTAGGVFTIVVNAQGAGISMITSILKTSNTLFYNNSGAGYGKAIYLEGSIANIDNCSFFNNIGPNEDIWGVSSNRIIVRNSTIKGSFVAFSSPAEIYNSTIDGGGYFGGNSIYKIKLDNVIWTYLNYDLTDTTKVNTKFSIIRNTKYGNSVYDTLATNLPNNSLWLDTLADNGGFTPTMKLKNVTYNPAKSFGNPIYLDSLDQRGAIRSDSVSIGAYQWVRVSAVEILNDSIKLCMNDSVELLARIYPQFASNTNYSFSMADTNIAIIQNNMVKPVSAGNTTLICVTEDGSFSDTVTVVVVGNIGFGVIAGDSIVCQGDNPVVYSVSPIANATSYLWTLPGGASGTSTTNSIPVNFGTTASSGNITVRGTNTCGDGAVSSLLIVVNEKPATPVITSIGNNIIQSSALNGNQWYNQNGIINGATNQNYTASANGTYFVIVSATYCNSDTSNVIHVTNTGITANNAENGFSINPNPASQKLTVTLENGGEYLVSIRTINGQVVLTQNGLSSTTLDVSQLCKGVYLLEVQSAKQKINRKLVIE